MGSDNDAVTKTLFGEIAIHANFSTRAAIEQALEEQERLHRSGAEMFLGQVLVKNGDLTLRQVSHILDIQKELVLAGVGPLVLASEKGRSVIANACKAATMRRLRPWGAAAMFSLLLVGGVSVATFVYRNALFTPAETVQQVAPKPEVTQLIEEIASPGLLVRERLQKLQQLDRYPDDIVLPTLEAVWRKSNAADLKSVAIIAQYSLNRNKEKAIAFISELLTAESTKTLGYLSLQAGASQIQDWEPFLVHMETGIASNDLAIQEAALFCLVAAKKAHPPEVVAKLKAIAERPDRPDFGAAALRALYANGKYDDYSYLLTTLALGNELTMSESVALVFQNGRSELYEELFTKSRESQLLLDTVIKFLKIYRVPEAEQFLVRLFASPNPAHKMAAARSLSSYSSPEVVSALATQLEQSDKELETEIAATLRLITKQDFGYQPDGTPAQNRAAIGKWQQYAQNLRR